MLIVGKCPAVEEKKIQTKQTKLIITLRILISFPSNVCVFERFFLVMDFIATSTFGEVYIHKTIYF